MIVTFIDGKYSITADGKSARSLINQLVRAAMMLAEDIGTVEDRTSIDVIKEIAEEIRK